jgi:cytochrome P450
MRTVHMIEYDPLDAGVQADPYPHYARLRADAPVQHVESLDAYAVSRHADVRRVMHDHRAFSNEAMAALVSRPAEYAAEAELVEGDDGDGVMPTSIVGTDGETHARLRQIVNRGFTPRRISILEGEMRALARSFVDELVAPGAGDLQAGLAVPFPTVVIAALLGVEANRRDEFRLWSEDMVRGVFEPTSAAQQEAIAHSAEQLGAWIDTVVEARAGTEGDDLVSVLLRAELEGGALTRDELRVFVITLLVAGSITTAYLIGNAVRALANCPELAGRVRHDPHLVPGVVEESLRHEAPVQLMFRTATTDVELAGTTIPAGATVMALIGSANRDASAFPDPDRFDPGRDASDHLSFGHGVHFCLGAALARLEARVALEELLARSKRLEPTGAPEQVASTVFRGPTRLELAFR